MFKMFSFFRKSKKDSPDNNKPKNNKEPIKEPVVQPLDMCKNDILPNPEVNNVMPLLRHTSSEFGLEKNVTNVATPPSNSEVTALAEKNETNSTTLPISQTKSMDNNTTSATFTPTTMSYANMLKNSEVVRDVKRSGAGVKPCGHGTTAISPRIPITGTKRENTNTPPSSPVLEVKKPFKGNAKQTQELPKSDDNLSKLKSPDLSDKDTVTATMKLHINLPKPTELLDNTSTKKNLINQEAKFQSQLNDLSKQLAIRDAEANKLRFQMEELQRDVFAKSAGMDRLQAELNCAHKESEIIRQRIRHLESELEISRKAKSQLTDDISNKEEIFSGYETETKAKIAELETVIKQLRDRIESLESQLTTLKEEKEILELRHSELAAEREEEKKKVAETIHNASQQKQEIERKWKEDFEKLRTVNIMKEQQLLDDFEWKLREVQQTCKKRLEDKDKAIEERVQEAYNVAEEKMKEVETMMTQIETLKLCENEVEQLRGLTIDQEKALKEMIDQQDQMKQAEESLKNETKRLRTLIEMEKENLQHMQRVHHQEIVDKERTLSQTLHQKRNEIAMYWEERLLRECGRLKMEMEQIHDEEKFMAMEVVRKQKDEDFETAKGEWEQKLRDCLNEIASLKKSLADKDSFYHEEIIKAQTNTDRDIFELRRLMDKIDMTHHDRYEKIVQEHEVEIERITKENEVKIKEVENLWQIQVTSLRATVELVKEQMEKESQQKIELLIQQHRSELDSQWENLIHQKSEAISLVEEEYVTKYNTLEEQFYTQQKSHSSREIELLKTIDSIKNELDSKESTIDDLLSNVDTLEGGVQVLNGEIAQHGDVLKRTRNEADAKIRNLEQIVTKLQEQQEKEREAFRLKFMSTHKQSQETIEHLQRKCQCLTKLFEEVRQRYERRESRQEDMIIISDLRQVVAEQEKDLACLNEEKRYFQMRLMNLEKQMEASCVSAEEDEFEDAQPMKHNEPIIEEPDDYPLQIYPTPGSMFSSGQMNSSLFIPPTIPECDDCDE